MIDFPKNVIRLWSISFIVPRVEHHSASYLGYTLRNLHSQIQQHLGVCSLYALHWKILCQICDYSPIRDPYLSCECIRP